MFENVKKKSKQRNCNHKFKLTLCPQIVSTYPHKSNYRCSKCGKMEVLVMSDEDIKEYERSQWVNGLVSLAEHDEWEYLK